MEPGLHFTRVFDFIALRIYYLYIYVHTEPVHAFLSFIVELGPLLSALGPLFSAVINPIRVEFVVRSEPPTRER